MVLEFFLTAKLDRQTTDKEFHHFRAALSYVDPSFTAASTAAKVKPIH
jgi:hypothetical protein